MIIELLYSSVSALYGEKGTIDYLKIAFNHATFIETEMNDIPYFVNNKVDLVFMGPTTERFQKIIIEKLLPYKNIICDKIENNDAFWITGNALEIFGSYIIDDVGDKIEALDIFPFYSKQELMRRFNSYVLATIQNLEVVGFKSQFTTVYPLDDLPVWMKMIRGVGFNKDNCFEGIKKNNFYGTHCLGPFLILNPLFTKAFFKSLGYVEEKIPFEEDLMLAYVQRVKEFKDEKNINYV
jgi:hypothetical protein